MRTELTLALFYVIFFHGQNISNLEKKGDIVSVFFDEIVDLIIEVDRNRRLIISAGPRKGESGEKAALDAIARLID